MKSVEFLPEAEDDLFEASAALLAVQPSLVQSFYLALDEAVERIREYPGAYQIVLGQTRRVLLKPFSYLLFYLDTPDKVIVTAIIHAHRDPDVWKTRLPESR